MHLGERPVLVHGEDVEVDTPTGPITEPADGSRKRGGHVGNIHALSQLAVMSYGMI